MVLLQCPQEEESLMGLLNKAGGVGYPRQVLRDVNPQELEAGDTFNSHTVDVDGFVCVSLLFPEVHHELLGFAGVEEQVIVSTPGS